jgi:hypothetical protein
MLEVLVEVWMRSHSDVLGRCWDFGEWNNLLKINKPIIHAKRKKLKFWFEIEFVIDIQHTALKVVLKSVPVAHLSERDVAREKPM